MNINNLTVYFSALSPFVTSYIIYKTAKGENLPLFNGQSQAMVDKSKNDSTINKPIVPVQSITQPVVTTNKEDEVIKPSTNIEIKDEEVG